MSINLRIHILPDVPDDVDIRPPAWVEDTSAYRRAYREGFADAAIQTRDLLADTAEKVGRFTCASRATRGYGEVESLARLLEDVRADALEAVEGCMVCRIREDNGG